jgi:hypothetical protein
VTLQQAEEGHTLEICLKQIERCKPYLIGMLGDSDVAEARRITWPWGGDG